MHILIGLPSPAVVDPDFALENLLQIIDYSRAKIPDLKISVSHSQGVRTDANRNNILKKALDAGNVDYILWLDTDMIYPVDIIEKYLEIPNLGGNLDIIGCLYFKRSKPYLPAAYEERNDTDTTFTTIHPPLIKSNHIYEVAAVGYGGMMVSMNTYKKLGDEKWTAYGSNFHIPIKNISDKESHDLKFCLEAKKIGLSIKLHGSVRAKHFTKKLITQEDWLAEQRKIFRIENVSIPQVHVLMPATDESQAAQAAKTMVARAGISCQIKIIMDDKKEGFIKIINDYVKANKPELIVYTAQDALVGQGWLKNALTEMLLIGAGLVGFNDGKWSGRLASFGLVQRGWYKQLYGGNLFHPGYGSHYADTELTQIAKEQRAYVYAENAIMMEVDHKKAVGKGKGVEKKDKKLYRKRASEGFDGLVESKKLREEFG
ncbi:MAG: hypothetical protein ABFQ62_00185 [Patescibacteria group bacterium]